MTPIRLNTKLARELKVGDKFRIEENDGVVLHEVVQAYSRRLFSDEIIVIKTDQGASFELTPGFEVELE